MGRTNPRVLAALAVTARRVIDSLATFTTVEKRVYAAIDEVAAYARGEKISKATLTKTCAAIDKLAEAERDWRTPQRKDYSWAVGAVGALVYSAATGADYKQHVLDHLGYGLAEQAKANRPAWKYSTEVAAWFADAMKTSTASSETIAKRVNAKAAALEAAALARITKALGTHGTLVAAKGARWSAKRAGSPAELKALLARKKVKANKHVLAFDAMFGGLMVPASTNEPDDWFESGEATIVGAFACLKQRGKAPDGGHAGHLPVVLTANDNEVYLDDKGAVWAMDTIEDGETVKLKGTPTQMIVKLLEDV